MTGARRNRFFVQVTILVALIAFGAYVVQDAIYGAHGLLARERLNSKIAILNQDLSALQGQRKRLEKDAELLNAKAKEQPELLDQEARSLLDFAHPTDIVIINDQPSPR